MNLVIVLGWFEFITDEFQSNRVYIIKSGLPEFTYLHGREEPNPRGGQILKNQKEEVYIFYNFLFSVMLTKLKVFILNFINFNEK